MTYTVDRYFDYDSARYINEKRTVTVSEGDTVVLWSPTNKVTMYATVCNVQPKSFDLQWDVGGSHGLRIITFDAETLSNSINNFKRVIRK